MVTNYYGTEKYFATIDLVSEYAAIIDCEENRSNIFDEPTINRVIFVMKYIYINRWGDKTPTRLSLATSAFHGTHKEADCARWKAIVSQNVKISWLLRTIRVHAVVGIKYGILEYQLLRSINIYFEVLRILSTRLAATRTQNLCVVASCSSISLPLFVVFSVHIQIIKVLVLLPFAFVSSFSFVFLSFNVSALLVACACRARRIPYPVRPMEWHCMASLCTSME